MSLSAWSYPIYSELNPLGKTPPVENRKKINRATKFTPPPPPAMDDDDALADYTEPEETAKESMSSSMPSSMPSSSMPSSMPSSTPPPRKQEYFATAQPQQDVHEKLDYLIRLLEAQKDEETGHVTEELILYLFLGIFVIFVLDSFVKTGKYSR
jgi:hypothetical protein